jgi:hypothetical protein
MTANWNFPRWPVAKKRTGRTLRIVGLATLFTTAALALLCHLPGFPVQIGMSSGPCMEPTLRGWQPLVFVRREAKLGDVVLCDWGEGRMVKRVINVNNRWWTVAGDNRGESMFRSIRPSQIVGVLALPKVPAYGYDPVRGGYVAWLAALKTSQPEVYQAYMENLTKRSSVTGFGLAGAEREQQLAWQDCTQKWPQLSTNKQALFGQARFISTR